MDGAYPDFDKLRKPNPFAFLLARLFGKPVNCSDNQTKVTGYVWRGNLYVWSMDEADETITRF